MDEHNVHQLWGGTPFMDLADACERLAGGGQAAHALRCLQICSYDARHTLATICRKARHPAISRMELFVFEEEPESLARHMLMLHVLLDGSLTAQERVETLLELHGNAVLREKTAAYLEAAARQLELVVTDAQSGGASRSTVADPQQRDQASATPVAALFDLSMLKYQERDALVEALQRCRRKVQYDMVGAWDARCRKWYAERYDFRRNIIDYDYHMRLLQRGTPGLDPALGSIVHFYHFRHWRLHGVAYELRDCVYTAPNLSLLTTATGRTKEFKDRLGNDRGRSVAARGYWGDALNSPFHCFGTVAEDARLFERSNKQFSHTAVDVAEHNIKAFLAELRTGQRWQPPPAGADVPQGSGAAAAPAASEPHRAQAARGPTGMQQLHQAQQGAGHQGGDGEQQQGEDGTQQDEPPREGDALAGSLQQLQLQGGQQPAAGPSGDTGPQAFSSSGGGDGATAADMQGRAAELAVQEAEADAAALRALQGVRITLLSGDPHRSLAGRSKLAGCVDCVTLGSRHAHLLGGERPVVAALLRPGGVALAETAKYLLQLSTEQAGLFADKVAQLAGEGGLQRVEGASVAPGAASVAPDGYLAFRLPGGQA